MGKVGALEKKPAPGSNALEKLLHRDPSILSRLYSTYAADRDEKKATCWLNDFGIKAVRKNRSPPMTPSPPRKDSFRSGLKKYSADGGVKDFALMGGAIWYFSRSWAITAGLRYARLFHEAADSPVVDKRRSANQWIGGIGVA
jgi:MltA-interacting protein MipA